MESFSPSQWSSWAYSAALDDPFSPYTQISAFPGYLADSMDAYQTQHNSHLVQQHHMSRATESKPRLSKDEVEVLEAEFQKNHKPSSSTKKALAESMRVDNARINNWFQNRRAREKKENNIREYEAKQRLEKDKLEAESVRQPDTARQRDLVASSAPFPEASSRARMDAASSPSAHSVQDVSSDTTEPSQAADLALSDGSPDRSSPQNRPVTPDFSNRQDDQAMMTDLESYLNAPDFSNGLPLNEPELMLSVGAKPSGQLLGYYHGFMGDAGQDAQTPSAAALAQLSPMADDSQPPSPQASDVASRRNRRPAPLSISGARSLTSPYTPGSATDVDARGDRASPLRRVASASGSRVRKAVTTPRSPFFDAAAASDVGSRSRRSPSLAAPPHVRAPLTPDTPVGLHQQALADGAFSYALDGKFVPADLALHDPTLRTPPATPGFMESLFSLGAGYDMSISEEALISPALSGMPTGFDMSGTAAALTGFVDGQGGCSNHHHHASSQLGNAYFGGLLGGGGAAGYSWPDLSASALPEPGLLSRQTSYHEHDVHEI
ncbi:hypothetical protein L249_3617 [Ophiocordyceps polyrhachis-furcata BCC 54312]|uniref:Homeobox domain-containing protein n=1 Tax=Ophiocordyceps polyrhachis-furcata BCC 54312 TaxID=1330021 RepID=A0A367LMT1_9HYPO|nr:hypothetical protein L249_3617 [Ophiocordyceps polyrhachis-furcata BCC 54312]